MLLENTCFAALFGSSEITAGENRFPMLQREITVCKNV